MCESFTHGHGEETLPLAEDELLTSFDLHRVVNERGRVLGIEVRQRSDGAALAVAREDASEVDEFTEIREVGEGILAIER